MDVAKKQIESEKENETSTTISHEGATNTNFGGSSKYPDSEDDTSGESFTREGEESNKNKNFYMSVQLDNTRVNRDIHTYLQEIIQHLMEVDGADVEMRLEVEVSAPDGIPVSTVRTVSENCRTLKITDFSFDN